MGKRELFLIALFAIAGTVVYQLTAAPPPPGREGFSIRRMIDHIRREVQSQNFKVDVARDAAAPVPASVVALNIAEPRAQVTIVGEDRADIVAHLETQVYGPDEPTARADADAVKLLLTPAGAGITLKVERPRETRRARTVLRLSVPSRLAIGLEGLLRTEISRVAQVTLDTRIADVMLQDIAGEVRGTHRDASITVTGAGGVLLDLRRATARFEKVGAGGVKGEYTDGRTVVRDVAGRIEIESRRTDIEIERPRGAMRFEATDGGIEIREAAAAIEFEGNRAGLTAQWDAPFALSATSTDARLDLRLPPGGGVTLDLAAEDGRIEAPDGLAPAGSNGTRTLAAPVNGGGPTWLVRTKRADIIIRP